MVVCLLFALRYAVHEAKEHVCVYGLCVSMCLCEYMWVLLCLSVFMCVYKAERTTQCSVSKRERHSERNRLRQRPGHVALRLLPALTPCMCSPAAESRMKEEVEHHKTTGHDVKQIYSPDGHRAYYMLGGWIGVWVLSVLVQYRLMYAGVISWEAQSHCLLLILAIDC